MNKKIIAPLRDLIMNVDLNDQEVKAFLTAMSRLNIEEQVELYRHFNQNKNLIYPTFINYMAKKRYENTGLD